MSLEYSNKAAPANDRCACAQLKVKCSIFKADRLKFSSVEDPWVFLFPSFFLRTSISCKK